MAVIVGQYVPVFFQWMTKRESSLGNPPIAGRRRDLDCHLTQGNHLSDLH